MGRKNGWGLTGMRRAGASLAIFPRRPGPGRHGRAALLRPRLRHGLAAVLAALLQLAAPAQAAKNEKPVNWYYSAAFGTGVYRTDSTTVTVFRLPLFKALKETEPGRWGLRALLPVTFGYYNYQFDDVLDLQLPSDLGTLSVVPGAEFQYQVNDRWLLKPFGQLGVGLSLDAGPNAAIYAAGARSRYYFNSNWMLGNALFLAGYDAGDGNRDTSVVFITGVNYVRPVSWKTFSKRTDVGLHFNYYLYPEKFSFEEIAGDVVERPVSVLQEGEAAVTIGWPDSPTLMGIPVERLGIAFRYSDQITGWRIVTEYPF